MIWMCMSEDLFIGFIETPVNLESFLVQEGYTKVDTRRNLEVYDHAENGSPTLFYHAKPAKAKKDEVPNWKEAGFTVVSDLVITCDSGAEFEGNRLADRVKESFRAVLYDPTVDEYST